MDCRVSRWRAGRICRYRPGSRSLKYRHLVCVHSGISGSDLSAEKPTRPAAGVPRPFCAGVSNHFSVALPGAYVRVAGHHLDALLHMAGTSVMVIYFFYSRHHSEFLPPLQFLPGKG